MSDMSVDARAGVEQFEATAGSLPAPIVRPRRVAVVGAASLVGLHLLDLLGRERADWTVTAFDNFATGNEKRLRSQAAESGARVQRLDVRDAQACVEALAGHDVVFHLAAILSMGFAERPRVGLETNLLGGLNVVDGAHAGGARLVLSSSCGGVYGTAPGGSLDESAPFYTAKLAAGTAMYGAGKLLLEAICKDRAERDASFEWVALRYSSVYGRFQHDRGWHSGELTANLLRLKRGEGAVFSRPAAESHDYVDARDVAMANLLAAEVRHRALNRTYNIASGVSTTNMELGTLLCAVAGSEIPPVFPAEGSVAPARPGVHIDVRAAFAELGFRPRISLADGLREVYEDAVA